MWTSVRKGAKVVTPDGRSKQHRRTERFLRPFPACSLFWPPCRPLYGFLSRNFALTLPWPFLTASVPLPWSLAMTIHDEYNDIQSRYTLLMSLSWNYLRPTPSSRFSHANLLASQITPNCLIDCQHAYLFKDMPGPRTATQYESTNINSPLCRLDLAHRKFNSYP